MSQMVSTILANVAALNGTTPFLDSTSEFAIAQSYSDVGEPVPQICFGIDLFQFTQGLLELGDAFAAAAATVTLWGLISDVCN